jgi:hypothetical protein
MLLAGVLTLVGVFTRGWFTLDKGEFEFGLGLMGSYSCAKWDGEERCEGKRFDTETKGRDKDIHLWRFGGFAGGLGSSVLAILCGVFALTRKPRSAPLVVLYIFVGIAFVFCSAYVFRVMSEMKGEMKPSLGYSFFLTYMGLVGAFVAGLAMIGPAAKKMAGGGMPMPYGGMPMQQGYPMQQPMMQQQPPMQGQACPRCGGQATFVAQYQRWFCQRCQQYV